LSVSCWTASLGKPAFQAAFISQLSHLGFKPRRILDGRFDEAREWSFEAIHVALFCKPRWPKFPAYVIRLNPSYFGSFTDLTCFFSLAIPGFDANRTKITVLDVSLDFREPLPTFRQRLRVKGYHRLECKFSREATLSLYLGDNPLYRVYDKGLEQHLGKGWFTRLELHTEKTHIPIRTFADLPKLPSLELFKSVRLEELNEPIAKSKLLRDFWCLYQRLGFEPAHFEFRRHRNYRRDIGRHLKVLKTESVDHFVRKGLQAFFNSPVSSEGGLA
jgi:hypothetical protein